MEIKLEIDDREVRNMIQLGERVYADAAAWSLNRAWSMLRTRVIRTVSAGLHVPSTYIRKRVRFTRARLGSLVVYLGVLTSRLNPARMDPKVTKAPGGGVTAVGRTYPGAFIAPGRGHGKPVVFRRKGYPASIDANAPRAWGQPQLPVEVFRIDAGPEVETAVEKHGASMAEEFAARIFPRELLRRMGVL